MPKIYADYNASYPCSDQHLTLLSRVIKKTQGNPSSIHSFGRDAKLILEEARAQVSSLFGGSPKNLLFTSGATEANNLALQGYVHSLNGSVGRDEAYTLPHVLISSGEHASVSTTMLALESRGQCELESVGLNQKGFVSSESLLGSINARTRLISLFYVNSEIGTINPLKLLIEQIKNVRSTIHIHVDAVQAVGKLDLTWMAGSKVDSIAASAHKIGGLKGIGCLFVKNTSALDAMLLGGGQERSLRSGTENMPGLISFGLRAREMIANPDWLTCSRQVQEHLRARLEEIPEVVVHGDAAHVVCNTVNFHVNGISGDRLALEFDRAGIALSRGSACSSGLVSPSLALLSMGYSDWVARNSIRVSFGAPSSLRDSLAIVAVIEKLLKT